MKKEEASYLINLAYLKDMDKYCKVNIGNNTIINLPHTRDDITGLQNSVDVAVNGTVSLQGQSIDVALAGSLIKLGKEVNVDLYVHLWDKFTEVDACVDDDAVALVVWEYDINQVYII